MGSKEPGLWILGTQGRLRSGQLLYCQRGRAWETLSVQPSTPWALPADRVKVVGLPKLSMIARKTDVDRYHESIALSRPLP